MTKIFILLLVGFFIINACEKEDDRREEEKIKLNQYLIEKGYTSIEPTNSGLYFVVISEGDGETPEPTDLVIFEYTASLIDGTIFDTSDRDLAVQHNILKDNKLYGPARFMVKNFDIPGLKEGIMLMNGGGKARIIIPSRLGLGSSEYELVPPYSTLIYDVELLDVISDPVEHEKKLLDEYIESNEITVQPTESGLYYIEKEAGSGNLVGDNAIVAVHYTGYLLDGRVFDESPTDEPLIYNTSTANFIPGFLEGVSKMRVSGKATLIIPWNIGFGAEGSGEGYIPPYTTIIYDVEVMDIQHNLQD